MKNLFLSLLLIAIPAFLKAQCNTFFPLKENVKLHYELYDKKDKLSMKSVQWFKDIKGSANAMTATLVQELIDPKKDKSIGTSDSEWSCENGTLHFTVNNMSFGMDNGQQANMGANGMAVEVTGDKMDLPSNFTVGQTLKDVNYNVKMSMSGVTIMNSSVNVKERKVEAKESVTTTAGTFDCFRVSFITNTKGGMGSSTVKTLIWYSKDVGTVKTENFSLDNKLLSRQILTKVEK